MRNCWSENDIQNEGCKIYDDEEICVCFTELCNFGQIQDPTTLNSTKSFITTQSSSITTTPNMTINVMKIEATTTSTKDDTEENAN